MKRWLLLLLPCLLWGCSLIDEETVQLARNRILDGEAECVLLCEYGTIEMRGRGLSPLLSLYDSHRAEMDGARLVDKVIGRAAAFIAINGKVRHVHGELMSEDAALLLNAHGITATHTTLVPRIFNRTRTGICPLEQAVAGIDDPEQALLAIRTKLTDLQAAPKGTAP